MDFEPAKQLNHSFLYSGTALWVLSINIVVQLLAARESRALIKEFKYAFTISGLFLFFL